MRMTTGCKQRRLRAGGLAAVIGVALLVAACGSSSSHSSASGAPSAPASSGPGGSADHVVIGTAKGPDGTYLTAASGRALYLWVGDSNDKSNCSGDCAASWPPVITKSGPTAAAGAVDADLGTITRSDGSRQVTYEGHPLYSFVVDSGSGRTKGQGSDNFGAKWWLVAPSGAAITVNGSSSGSPPSAY